MSNKSINDLREALFDTLQKVKDGAIDIENARAVNELGKTLIDSAKVEVEYLRVTGGGESTFIDTAIGADNLPAGLPNGITAITRHRIQG